jgi:hypothetical protein
MQPIVEAKTIGDLNEIISTAEKAKEPHPTRQALMWMIAKAVRHGHGRCFVQRADDGTLLACAVVSIECNCEGQEALWIDWAWSKAGQGPTRDGMETIVALARRLDIKKIAIEAKHGFAALESVYGFKETARIMEKYVNGQPNEESAGAGTDARGPLADGGD